MPHKRIFRCLPFAFSGRPIILRLRSSPMPTFHIEHFGCRATQADAAAIERQLLDSGYLPSAGPRDASVIVVSTCTVTSSADAQARQAIRLLHRENPQARIAVTGCYAQRAPEEVASLDGVSCVVGNSHQTEIPRLLSSEAAPSLAAASPASAFFPLARLDGEALSLAHGPTKILTGNIFEQSVLANLSGAPVLGDEDGHTRPILKIQDGCNHRCAYCVIASAPRASTKSFSAASIWAAMASISVPASNSGISSAESSTKLLSCACASVRSNRWTLRATWSSYLPPPIASRTTSTFLSSPVRTASWRRCTAGTAPHTTPRALN